MHHLLTLVKHVIEYIQMKLWRCLEEKGLSGREIGFLTTAYLGISCEVKVGDEYSGSFEVTILICTWDTLCCRCCSPLYINSIVDILSEARVGVE